MCPFMADLQSPLALALHGRPTATPGPSPDPHLQVVFIAGNHDTVLDSHAYDTTATKRQLENFLVEHPNVVSIGDIPCH